MSAHILAAVLDCLCELSKNELETVRAQITELLAEIEDEFLNPSGDLPYERT